MAWFRRTYPGVRILAIPNGGARHPVVAAKLKLEGVCKGVPDLFIPEWHLWIEMKAIGGKESPEQKDWREYLTECCQYDAVVCEGFERAKEFILGFVE